MGEPTEEQVSAALAFYETDRKLAKAYREGTVEALEAERRRRLKFYVVGLWICGVLIAVSAAILFGVWIGANQ